MKRLLLILFIFSSFANSSFAQIELKTKILPPFYKKIGLSAEYIVAEKLGVEVNYHMLYGHMIATVFEQWGENSLNPDLEQDYRLKKDGYRAWIGLKFYFAPDGHGEGIYVGGYAGQRNLKASDYPDNNTFYNYDRDFEFKSPTAGLLFGYKGVLDNNITIDMSGALGGFFSNKITYADPRGDVSSFEWGEMFFNFTVGYRFNFGKQK